MRQNKIRPEIWKTTSKWDHLKMGNGSRKRTHIHKDTQTFTLTRVTIDWYVKLSRSHTWWWWWWLNPETNHPFTKTEKLHQTLKPLANFWHGKTKNVFFLSSSFFFFLSFLCDYYTSISKALKLFKNIARYYWEVDSEWHVYSDMVPIHSLTWDWVLATAPATRSLCHPCNDSYKTPQI